MSVYGTEHEMASQIDRKLLKRLLGYATKHKWPIVLSLALLVVVVAIDLARPVIIGKAVDEVIINYDKIYSVVEAEVDMTQMKGSVVIQGQSLVLEEQSEDSLGKKAILVYGEEGYYLVSDLTMDEALAIQSDAYVDGTGATSQVVSGDSDYLGVLMSKEEMRLLRQSDFGKLVRLMVIFIGILIAGLLIGYYQTILLHYTGQKIIYDIRKDIFAHIQGLSVEFFNEHPVGQLVTRVTNDTETLNEMYTSVIVNSVKSVLTLIGIAGMMMVLNLRLSLIVFMVVPLIGLATWLFRKYSRKAYRDVRTKVSAVNTFLSEHISGMKIVQIFHKEKSKMAAFNEINTGLKKANLRQLLIFGVYRPSMYFLYVIGLGLVLGFGGWQVMKGLLTLGVLVMFIQYISNFFDPIQQLAEQFNILQSAFASAEKIFTLLDDHAVIEDAANAKELKQIDGRIEFKNVSFAYVEDDYVLKDVSFTVEPGETVAFVGATGAGKTSILNLLSRYYDIQEGEILIDGVNIKHLKKHNIRRHIGQMLQDVFLFTGTIRDNISLGDESISEEAMIEAAKTVNAYPFISKLKEGFKEPVYERGATFSAGQRQLLSFARTLAYKPSILVLDEATANIDTETEILIQDALKKLMEGRTTLVVAHRLSTIQHADKIVVLHKGRIKEIGNHQTLLANKGLYYNLYRLQYSD